MAIARDEIFGPVLTVMPFDTLEEAIADRQRYGLWPRRQRLDQEHRQGAAGKRRVRAGRFWVNTTIAGGPELPIGGFKQSGWGAKPASTASRRTRRSRSVHIGIGKRTPGCVMAEARLRLHHRRRRDRPAVCSLPPQRKSGRAGAAAGSGRRDTNPYIHMPVGFARMTRAADMGAEDGAAEARQQP